MSLSGVSIPRFSDKSPYPRRIMVSDKTIRSEQPSSLTLIATVQAGGEDCDKYCWYRIVPIDIIKNELSIDLGDAVEVAIEAHLPQPAHDLTYTFELALYNARRPDLGLRIINFKP